jgi:glycerol uptake facilitator-like aquaporin
LNSGIVLGFFNLKETKYAVVFAFMGMMASVLWVWVCLGSKFWQTRWEQRLFDFEKEYFPGLDFFSAEPARLLEDVTRGFAFEDLGTIQRSLYGLALLKPSVSYSMLRLSMLFVSGWIAVIVIFLFKITGLLK